MYEGHRYMYSTGEEEMKEYFGDAVTEQRMYRVTITTLKDNTITTQKDHRHSRD